MNDKFKKKISSSFTATILNERNDSKEKTAFVITALLKKLSAAKISIMKHCAIYKNQKHDETFCVIYTNKRFKVVKIALE